MGINRDTPAAFVWSRDGPALLFAMLFPTLGTWFYFVLLEGHALMRPGYTVIKAVEFLFPAAWVWFVQKRPIQPEWPTRRGVGLGLGFAVFVVAGTMALYYGYFRTSSFLERTPEAVWQKSVDIGADTPATYFALAMFLAVVHSLFEEYYWRWFVFGQLRCGLPIWVAIVVSSTAFALHHVIVIAAYMKPEHFWTVTLGLSLCVAAGGAAWAWIYQRSGSIYAAWLSHLVIDVGLMWIGFDLCRRYWT
jgi:hypothetical protein